jgi:hypothetical protein
VIVAINKDEEVSILSGRRAAVFLCYEPRFHRCGPIRAKAFSAQKTWL